MVDATKPGRWWGIAAAALALAGIGLAFVQHAPAQSKKGLEDKAIEGKAAKEQKEFKLIPPKVVDKVDPSTPGIAMVSYINEEIEKNWIANKVQPSNRCTDFEFIRRASLDIIGRIPTVAEIDRFLKDPELTRRTKLIDRLLTSDAHRREYADNFATQWTVLLMTRSGSKKPYRAMMHEWLSDEFYGGKNPCDWSETATKLITAVGDTNKNPAVNYVLHQLGEEIRKDSDGNWDMVPLTSRTTRLFMGIRTQCVQCHDHPFNGEWNQQHFWGINAFFRQIDTTNGRPSMMANKKVKVVTVQQYGIRDNANLNPTGLVSYERRNGVLLYTKPMFLDGKKLAVGPNVNRREALAKMVTGSPYFAKAYVNRMWNHFMGKSFTKDAVDDFGENNPPSHPELLDKLARDWAEDYRHDPTVLIRWICNSRAYGLSSVANSTNDKPEDETMFARMLQKPMTPEQLFESLMTATNPKYGASGAAKDERREKREKWLDQLVINFGNDEGEEGTFNGTVVQALLLMNGNEINNVIMDQNEGTVAEVLRMKAFDKKQAEPALHYLFKAALSRPATDAELKSILYDPQMFSFRPGSKITPAQPTFWTGYYQDMLWALVNSNEFILNH